MKLVIDISEEDRADIANIHFVREDLKFKIGKAIMNGILLPKGHGRLIDADDIDNHIIGHVDTRSCPTIIKADKTEREE